MLRSKSRKSVVSDARKSRISGKSLEPHSAVNQALARGYIYEQFGYDIDRPFAGIDLSPVPREGPPRDTAQTPNIVNDSLNTTKFANSSIAMDDPLKNLNGTGDEEAMRRYATCRKEGRLTLPPRVFSSEPLVSPLMVTDPRDDILQPQ